LEIAPRPGKRHERLLKIVEWSLNKSLVLFKVQQKSCPERVLTQDTRVSKKNEAEASPGERDVETTGVREETNALSFTRAHTRYKNNFLLSPLKCINAVHFYRFIDRCRKGA
jgi:hypothetical protein